MYFMHLQSRTSPASFLPDPWQTPLVWRVKTVTVSTCGGCAMGVADWLRFEASTEKPWYSVSLQVPCSLFLRSAGGA
jgi:hypothetical protein